MPNMNLLDLQPFKGELSPKTRCGLYDRVSSEGFYGVSLAYIRSLKVPKRPVEVSCDVTQHLVAYNAGVLSDK